MVADDSDADRDGADDDVPTSVDFRDPSHARAWVDATIAKRPYRPRFFAAFASALRSHGAAPLSPRA